jgi:hypothetical protein
VPRGRSWSVSGPIAPAWTAWAGPIPWRWFAALVRPSTPAAMSGFPNPCQRPPGPSRRGLPRLALALASGTLLTLGWGGLQAAMAAESSAGDKGAQVYCFLRSNGNVHEVSWIAAYSLIKRQSASLFKTSPEHAAVMITEAVVQNPGSYPDCGRYIGDLYSRRIIYANPSSGGGGSAGASSTQTRGERYAN